MKFEKVLNKLTTKNSIGIIIFAIILIPFVTLFILKNPSSFGIGKADSWIGFYGSYFGAIISGLVTLLLIKIHLNIKENEILEENKSFIRTIVEDYFTTIEVVISNTIKHINDNLASTEVVYIPFSELFFDESYFTRVLNSDLTYKDKYEFISLFHTLKGLIHLSERNIIMREQQNLLMISSNVSTTNSKLIAVALGKTYEDFEEENKHLEGLFERIIYPVLTDEASKYVEYSEDALKKIRYLKTKYETY